MLRSVGSRLAIPILGLLFVAATLDFWFVAGSGQFWLTPSGDVADAQIGWFYYARDLWRFPLFFVGNYHHPEGSFVTLSDSLPLLALIFKSVYKLAYVAADAPPIYAGMWCAVCFFLQVVAASRLLLSLGIRHPLQHCAGLVIFCYVPWLFFRFGQFGLLAHFFLLVGLGDYVRVTRRPPLTVKWWTVCAGPVVALLLHPYIAAMCWVFLLATVIESCRRKQLSVTDALTCLSLTMASTVSVMLVGGGYLTAAAQSFHDYGTYSLNLLSPFIPLPGSSLGRLLNTTAPTIPGIFQWEGACYLGAGVLVLVFAVLPAIRNAGSHLKRHWVLAVLSLATLVFAISNRVGFGSLELFVVPLPDGVLDFLSLFRGSGRFVWISAYTLMAFVVLIIARHYSPRTATVLLCGAALLQFADVAPMQADIRVATSHPASSTINRDVWLELIGQHSAVFEFPSFECGGLYNADIPGGRWRALEIDWLVAKAGKSNNSAYLTRYTKDCGREREDVLRVRGTDTLYLYRSTEDIGALLSGSGMLSPACGYLDDVVVCSPRKDLSYLR